VQSGGRLTKVECWCKLLAQLSLAFLLTELDRGEAVAQEAQPNSALGTNIGAVTERNSSLNDLVSEQVEAGLGWTPVPVFTGGFTDGIVSGDGRGDGTVRLYATHIQTNTIREFTFDKSWMNI